MIVFVHPNQLQSIIKQDMKKAKNTKHIN
jgi:hypothetical protein